jgi:hypothetical protein
LILLALADDYRPTEHGKSGVSAAVWRRDVPPNPIVIITLFAADYDNPRHILRFGLAVASDLGADWWHVQGALKMTHVDAVLPRWKRYPRRNKRTPKPRQPFDKRTGAGRRAHALTNHFRQRLGSIADDPVTATAIERAAQLQALAEEARARALRSDPKVTLDDVVRLNRLAEHAVRALHLDRHNMKQQPSLADYLAARGGQP